MNIYFENERQYVIWACELRGQVSDGFWEDVSDDRIWQAKFSIDPQHPGCDFEHRYIDLYEPDMLFVVGSRILFYVRATLAFPELMKKIDESHKWLAYPHKYFKMDLIDALGEISKHGYTQDNLIQDLTRMTEILALTR